MTYPKKKSLEKKLIVLASFGIMLALVTVVLSHHDKTTVGSVETPTNISSRKSKPITDKGSNNTSSASTPPETNNTKGASGSAATATTSTIPATPTSSPAKPYGTFVSNHRPGQNGSPMEEASVCNTTPGIVCVITFTKDGVVKTLPSKTADNDGTVYWSSWTPQNMGLTAGEWIVTATAGAGQFTASTQDPTVLKVSQ
jgi:hypothetical protein